MILNSKFLLAVLASLLLLCPVVSKGQQLQLTQTVKGMVMDKAVKTPLIGATIRVIGSGETILGAITDLDGRFRISNVPVGKIAMKISYLGYKELLLNNITVNSGKEVALEIEMQEDLIRGKEVVIKAKLEKQKALNQLATVSSRAFSVEETQRFAAAVNDPARMAISFAGVVMATDGNNTIVIRGNAPNGLLWRMEGIDIPAPNHFSNVGTSGGGVSILSSQLLSNSDFMTGAFPAEYGNATSGVFDLKLRKGNQDKREFTFQAGVLGLDAAVEGPMAIGKEKGSYLVNYRYSTLSLLSNMGVNIGEGTTNFQDLSFHTTMSAGKAGEFSLFGIGGLSSQTSFGVADSALWEDDLERKYTEAFIAHTGIVGLSHKKAWDNTFLKTVLAASVTKNGFQQEELQEDYAELKQYDQQHLQKTYTLSTVLNHKFNSRHFLRTGAYLKLLSFDFRQFDFNWDDKVLEEKVNQTGKTGTLDAFAQWQYRVSERLTLNTGVHSLYFMLNGQQSLEPRSSVKYAFSERNSLSFGYGLHAQIQPLGIYFASDEMSGSRSNRDLELSKAHHFVLSYDQMLPGNLHLKTEAYYQALYNVPVSKYENNAFSLLNHIEGFETQALDNKGIGKNYGLELTFEKFLTRGLYFLLSSAWYESKYQGSDGIWRNTRYNGNYATSFTGGKEWTWNKHGKNRSVGFNVKLISLGGFHESPIDLAASKEKSYTVRDETRAFEDQMPAYFRLDLGFRLKRNYSHLTTTFGIDIQNSTNRANVYGRYYDADKDAVVTAYQGPLIPILFYRIEF